jgi:hypothetical protein
MNNQTKGYHRSLHSFPVTKHHNGVIANMTLSSFISPRASLQVGKYPSSVFESDVTEFTIHLEKVTPSYVSHVTGRKAAESLKSSEE